MNKKRAWRSCALSAGALSAIAGSALGADWNNPAGGPWNVATNWTPNDVPNTLGESAVISLRGGYTVTIPTSTGFAVGLFTMSNADALVQIGDNASLTLGDNAHLNNGVVRINNAFPGGFNSILSVTGSVGGSGAFILDDAEADDAQLNGLFTQGPGHSILGRGQLNATLTNNGLVAADIGGQVLNVTGGTKVNNGVMSAVDGGILAFTNTTIDQSGGGSIGFDANGSLVRFTGSTNSTVIGGAIDAEAGANPVLRDASGTTTLTGITLNADLQIGDNGTIIVNGGGITNNGTIAVNNEFPGGFNSILNVTGGLDGVGAVFLNDNEADDAQLNGEIVQAATHTVHGQGRLNAIFTNNGLVSADVEGGTLFLISNIKINNNVMEAVDGGTLAIQSISVDQSAGGSLVADGAGSLIRFVAASNSTVVGGTIDAFNGAPPVLRDASGTTTLLGVTLNTDLQIGDNATVVVDGGGITNNGTIAVNNEIGGGFNSILQVDGLLDGDGVVFLNDNESDDAQLNGTFTQAAAHAIRGQGRLNAALTNNGLVSADLEGRTLFLIGNNKVNNNVMEAVNGGTLGVQSVSIDQTAGGSLVADGPGSLIRFVAASNSTIVGGTIDAMNGAPPVLRDNAATTTLTGVTLNADLQIGDNATVIVDGGGITNNGTIAVNSEFIGGFNSILQIDGLLDGGGVVFLNDNEADDAQLNGTFTQDETHTIRGQGNINATLTNLGLVSADVPGRTLTLQGAPKVNQGVMEARDGGTLAIASTSIDQTAMEGGTGPGALVADGADSLIRFNGGTSSTVTGGSIDSTNGAPRVLRADSGTTTFNGVALNADMLVGSNATLVVNPPFTNNGELYVNDLIAGGFNSVLSVAGPATVEGQGAIILGDFGDDAQLSITGGPLTISADQTLRGGGQVSGSLINQGEVNPGLPTGAVPLTGSYTQTASGAFRVTLAAINDFSRLNANGPATLDGGTIVEVAPGFVPPIGSEYPILTASAVTGQMPVIEAPVIGRLIFGTIIDPTQVRLVVSYCADLNNDNAINSQDLNILLAAFGSGDAGDINGDDLTNSQDLNLLLAVFGQLCD